MTARDVIHRKNVFTSKFDSIEQGIEQARYCKVSMVVGAQGCRSVRFWARKTSTIRFEGLCSAEFSHASQSFESILGFEN